MLGHLSREAAVGEPQFAREWLESSGRSLEREAEGARVTREQRLVAAAEQRASDAVKRPAGGEVSGVAEPAAAGPATASRSLTVPP